MTPPTKPPSFFSVSLRPWGLLTAAGMIACAATALGFLGRFHWFLDLFSHFRLQYLAGLLLIAAPLYWARYRKTAILFVAFAAVNLATILPLYFGRQKAPENGLPLRAMLININTHYGDAVRIKDAITEANPHILVLEEISDQWVADLAWLADSHPHSVVEPREDNFGIGLFSVYPLIESEVVYIGSAGVPSILATVDTGRVKLRVVATHPMPPGGYDYSRWRNEQLEQLPDHLQSPHPLILLGDLNVTPWNHYFHRLLAKSGLRDSAKGFGLQPTWPEFCLPLRIPIDHILHSSGIVVVNRRIGKSVSSDHLPVIVDFVVMDAVVHRG